MKKKIVSLLLVFCLLVSLAPAALAEGENADTGATSSEVTEIVGETGEGDVNDPADDEQGNTEETGETEEDESAQTGEGNVNDSADEEQGNTEETGETEEPAEPEGEEKPEEKPEEPVAPEEPEKPEEPVEEPFDVKAAYDELAAMHEQGDTQGIEDYWDSLSEAQQTALTAYVNEMLGIKAPAEDGELYDALMATETLDDWDILMADLSEEELDAFFAGLSEEELAALESHRHELVNIENQKEPARNYSNVAPLYEVERQPLFRMFSLRGVDGETDDTEPADELKKVDGLNTAKTVSEPNDDGEYTIRLEAYTTGTVTNTETTKPTDIIFVLDQSGSMANNIYRYTYTAVYANNLWNRNTYYVDVGGKKVAVTWCSECDAWTSGCEWEWFAHVTAGDPYIPMTSANDTTEGRVTFYRRNINSAQRRLVVLQNAVTAFKNSVIGKTYGEDKAAGGGDDVDHRIAMVGFSSSGFNNTELLTGVNITTENAKQDGNTKWYPDGYAHNGAQYGSITSEQYQAALQDMSTEAGQNSVTNAINALTAHGGTQTYDGLDMAAQIFENDTKADEDRNRVVILFTDGDTDSTPSDVINKAYALKNTYGATVYTIGVFSGADGSLPAPDDTGSSNYLMHAVSSNYPDAYDYDLGEINSNLDLDTDESYYLSADDTDTLNDIFEKISQQISQSNVDLGSTATIKDIVADSFEIPAGATITVKTANANANTVSSGYTSWDTETVSSLTPTVNGSTVTVTGFDYNANFVSANARSVTGGTTYGAKLIIEFPVKVREGFWGGNQVPTNGADSGVYGGDGTLVENFDRPMVNVRIKDVSVEATDKNVYLLSDVTAEQLKSGTAITVGDVSLDLSKANYGLASWQNAYVNTAVVVKDKNGNVIMSLDDLQEDTTYTVSVTVSPKYDGTGANGTPATAVSGNDEASINVFTPVVTFQDSDVYYGDEAPDTDDMNAKNYQSVTWKHGDTVADATEMGAAPELTYTYTIESGAIGNGLIVTRDDFSVSVAAAIGGTDVTSYTNFQHTCTETDSKPADGVFWFHVKTCTLTISKSGWQTIDENQSFIFTVKKTSSGITMSDLTVTVQGNGSVKITGLPVGTYTVTEDSGWSWRYALDSAKSTDKCTVNKDNATGSVTMVNSRVGEKWLSGCAAAAVNKFTKKETTIG